MSSYPKTMKALVAYSPTDYRFEPATQAQYAETMTSSSRWKAAVFAPEI